MQTTRLRQKERFEYIALLLICGIIAFGLMLRDTYGFGINRYIFLGLAAIPIFFFRLEILMAFISFLIPLYVGLPGNYISAILTIRLLYAVYSRQIYWRKDSFAISMCMALYVLIQNIYYGHMSVYNIVGAVDFVVIGMLITAILQYDKAKEAIVFFGLGVCTMSVIMLMTTLNHFSLTDLMNSATRLGDTGMLDTYVSSSMVVSIDPNFLGMNAIAVVSTCYLILKKQKLGTLEKAAIFVMSCAVAGICLMGLSRAYVLVLVIWGLLILWFQRSFKSLIGMVLAIGLFVIIGINMFPEVIDGIIMRFNEGDMAGGNGRINLILKYYYVWEETLFSMLFGMGLYNCHTHCGPLLYLFGIGIVGFAIIVSWFGFYMRRAVDMGRKIGMEKYVPFVVTFIAFSSIPAAGAINYTYPLVISMLPVALTNRKK